MMTDDDRVVRSRLPSAQGIDVALSFLVPATLLALAVAVHGYDAAFYEDPEHDNNAIGVYFGLALASGVVWRLYTWVALAFFGTTVGLRLRGLRLVDGSRHAPGPRRMLATTMGLRYALLFSEADYSYELRGRERVGDEGEPRTAPLQLWVALVPTGLTLLLVALGVVWWRSL